MATPFTTAAEAGPPGTRGDVRVLVSSASLRANSLNTRLAHLAARIIERHGGSVDLASRRELDAPAYDQDAQERDGFPP